MEPNLQQPSVSESSLPTYTPESNTIKSVNNIKPILLSVILTALLVGGGVYMFASNKTNELNTKLQTQEKQLQELKIQQFSQAVPTVTLGGGISPAPQPIISPTMSFSSSSNANLVTYQDPNIPVLKFTYDKSKWEVKKLSNELTQFVDKNGSFLSLNKKTNGGGGCGPQLYSTGVQS